MEKNVIALKWSNGARHALHFNKFILWPLGLWPIKCNDAFSKIRLGIAFGFQVTQDIFTLNLIM